MAKPILISGVKPTGKLHLGNYLGAIQNFVELQDSGKYHCLFFIADLHSLNVEFDPKQKATQILELTADYIAAGLDLRKSLIFQQSQIPAHSELAILLENFTPLGELKRMTQFKEKSARGETNVNAGLFNYPILMSADVLLYNAKFVPVGEDQLQHLELTRALARKFNKKFGRVFIEPQAILTTIPRVMRLNDPRKKMDKSDPDGCIFLDDSPAHIKEKVERAVTDSGREVVYDEKNKPGMSNLLKIYSSLSGKTIEKLEKEFAGKTYSEFKSKLAEAVADHFADYRKKKKSLMAQSSILTSALRVGSAKAAKIAEKKIAEVKKKIGIAL